MSSQVIPSQKKKKKKKVLQKAEPKRQNDSSRLGVFYSLRAQQLEM